MLKKLIGNKFVTGLLCTGILNCSEVLSTDEEVINYFDSFNSKDLVQETDNYSLPVLNCKVDKEKYLLLPELCNGIDDNCNDLIDEGLKYTEQFPDEDKDGFGDQDISILECKNLTGYVKKGLDCDDTNSDINPNKKEVCDGLDNDCNGSVDEKLIQNCSTACGVGLEECIMGVWKNCTAPSPLSEICDGLDNDCNGGIDDGLQFNKWYKDKDKDGYGDFFSFISACQKPVTDESGNAIEFVLNNVDMDDNNPLVCKSILWKSEEPLCSNIYPFLAIDDSGVVYTNDNNGLLHTFTPNGPHYQSNEQALNPVISNDGIVYTREGQSIKAFEKGTKKWEYPVPLCSDIGDWGSLELSSDSGVYHISASTDENIYASVKFYEYDPWSDDHCGYIIAVSKEGVEQWKVDMEYFNTGTSIGPGGTIYSYREWYPAGIYVINPEGTIKWKKDMSKLSGWGDQSFGEIIKPPVFGQNGELYFVTSNEYLIAYDSINEEILGSVQHWGKQEPVIDANGVIYSTKETFNQNGAPVVSYGDKLKGNFSGGVYVSNESIYLFGKDGIVTLNPQNWTESWKLEKDEQTGMKISPLNLVVGRTSLIDDEKDKQRTIYFCNETDNKIYAVCGTESLDENALWPMESHDSRRTKNFNTE